MLYHGRLTHYFSPLKYSGSQPVSPTANKHLILSNVWKLKLEVDSILALLLTPIVANAELMYCIRKKILREVGLGQMSH